MHCVAIAEIGGQLVETPVKRTSANHHYIACLVIEPGIVGPDGRDCFGKMAVFDTFDEKVAAGPIDDPKDARMDADARNGAEHIRQQKTGYRLDDTPPAGFHRPGFEARK